jgi:hypothetical protein
MTEKAPSPARRYQRVPLAKGIFVAWQESSRKEVSRIRTLGLGGLFIATSKPAPIGAILKLIFEVPNGDVRARAVVRNVEPGAGMGIEFTGMNYEDRGRLTQLLKKLLT